MSGLTTNLFDAFNTVFPVTSASPPDLTQTRARGTNPLHKFQTYNSIFTFAALSKAQQNSQKPLDKSSISNIIARTAGDWGDKNKRVKTDFGSFDYFIDDVVIVSIPTLTEKTGNTFATKVSFKVTEPYSMGLFFLSLQAAAEGAGYGNFKEAPYVFMIEWLGNVNDNPTRDSPEDLTRFIPIKLIQCRLKVSGSGSIYEVEAVPYNEHAFRDQTAKVTTDIQISGAKVEELLAKGETSLVNQLAKRYTNEKNKRSLDDVDEYKIEFPESYQQETGESNIISQSLLYDKLDAAGSIVFPDLSKPEFWLDQQQLFKTSSLKIQEGRVWQFIQEATIPDVITEVIIRSRYIVDQIVGGQFKHDEKGMVNWFRIETKIQDKNESKQLGRQKRIITYRVVPYKIHVHRFLPPSQKPPGYQILENTVAREYNYIYTGKNTDIINFDIQFDMAFFTPVPSDSAENVGQKTPGLGSILAGGELNAYKFPPTADISATAQQLGINQTPDVGSVFSQFGQGTFNSGALTTDSVQNFLLTGSTQQNQRNGQEAGEAILPSEPSAQKKYQYKGQGGAGSDNEETSQVRTLQALLTNEGDMLNITVEILGDPYYVPTSGMGNQIVPERDFNTMRDGAMNYQSGELDILIKFRTPIDFDPTTGLYTFAKTVDLWSGLYNVIQIESKFYQGKFTQILKAYRRRVQLGGATVQKPSIFLQENGKREFPTGSPDGGTPGGPGSPTTPPGPASPTTPGDGPPPSGLPGVDQALAPGNLFTDFGAGILRR